MSDAIETPTTTETKAPAKTLPDPAEVAEKHVKTFGSAEAAIVGLHNENYKEREKNRELRAKMPEGCIVLSADQAKAWEAYQSIGRPEEIRKIKSEHATATAENQGFKRKEEIAKFGKLAGVPAEKWDALARIAGGVSFETQKVKGEKGKDDIEKVFVKDGDAEPVEFDTYFVDYLPAIKPNASEQQQQTTKPESKGTPRRNGFNQRPVVTQAQVRDEIIDGSNPAHIRASIRASGIGSF